jgi:hypothetical protein
MGRKKNGKMEERKTVRWKKEKGWGKEKRMERGNGWLLMKVLGGEKRTACFYNISSFS